MGCRWGFASVGAWAPSGVRAREATGEGKIFFNSFDYKSKEDILYYLLFTFSELSLNPDNIHLVCCGLIDLDSELYALLYNYIRNIELLEFHEIEGIESNILKSNVLLSSFK